MSERPVVQPGATAALEKRVNAWANEPNLYDSVRADRQKAAGIAVAMSQAREDRDAHLHA